MNIKYYCMKTLNNVFVPLKFYVFLSFNLLNLISYIFFLLVIRYIVYTICCTNNTFHLRMLAYYYPCNFYFVVAALIYNFLSCWGLCRGKFIINCEEMQRIALCNMLDLNYTSPYNVMHRSYPGVDPATVERV